MIASSGWRILPSSRRYGLLVYSGITAHVLGVILPKHRLYLLMNMYNNTLNNARTISYALFVSYCWKGIVIYVILLSLTPVHLARPHLSAAQAGRGAD